MITLHLMALKASIRTLLLIGALATLGAGVLTLGVGMDTPWAPWERQSDTMFPPALFTLATFVATVAVVVVPVVLLRRLMRRSAKATPNTTATGIYDKPDDAY